MSDRNNRIRPIQSLRDGAIEVAVWKHDGDSGPFYTTERTRSYKDNNGDWQKTHSIPERDLLKAARLDGKAYEAIQHIRVQERAHYVEHQQNRAQNGPSRQPGQDR